MSKPKHEFGGNVLEQFTNGGTAGFTGTRPRPALPKLPAGPFTPAMPAQPTIDMSFANPTVIPDVLGNVPDAAELRTPEQQAAFNLQEQQSNQRVLGEIMPDNGSIPKPAPASPVGSDANNPMYGSMIAGGIRDVLDRRNLKAQAQRLQQLGNTDAQGVYEEFNPFGNYTPNAGIGNNFQPTQHISTQRQAYEHGGQADHAMPQQDAYGWLTDFLTGAPQPFPESKPSRQFKEGGEYQLSDAEIADLRAQGYNVEDV